MPLDLPDWHGRKSKSKAKGERLRFLAQQTSRASNSTNINGEPKQIGKPRPITLPKLKCLEEPHDE